MQTNYPIRLLDDHSELPTRDSVMARFRNLVMGLDEVEEQSAAPLGEVSEEPVEESEVMEDPAEHPTVLAMSALDIPILDDSSEED